jgi:hypothetical protein
VQTQYCRNVLAGTTSCAGLPGAEFITNPTHQLKGVWTDPTPVPSDIVTLGLAQNLVDDPIAAEAMRASAHFKYDPYATYIILTPPSTIGTGQPVYCGYHTQTTSLDGYGNPYRIEYAFIPFLNMDWPGVGTGGCGMHNVNPTSDAFGNGIFDGYTIATGHEYSEAVTDPDNFFANQDGWNDVQGSENADKCAWIETQNIALAVAAASAIAAPSPSSNWAGYAVTSIDPTTPVTYSSVSGAWTQPAANCTSTAPAYSAFWVGLGGYAETSQGLEQIGTESDCTAGRASYGVWYELVPAASVPVKLKLFPGNRISANVTVNGQLVTVQLKNLTRKTSFTKRLFMAAPDVSSAEWIAEAPSACDSTGTRCRTLPLADFGTVAFTSAKALAAGHGGAIVDGAWAANAIELAALTRAMPSDVAADGGSFSVTWTASDS